MAKTKAQHVRVAIAGSGFGGLGAAIRLMQSGVDDLLVFERDSDVGGVWRDNTYPGCACDVESHLYSFSFARNPDWTRSFSPQAEIWSYLRACAERFGVLPKVRFEHAVEEATWDEDARRWRLVTSQGVYTADFFVAAVGALSEPSIPRLPGLETFAGTTFHSARWKHEHDLSGRRVAVIGTGASAIQFVPAIQPKVAALKIFQRTPPWIVPRGDRALGALQKRILRRSNALQWTKRASIYARREVMALAFFDTRAAKVAQRLAMSHLRRSVSDPALRAKLTPSYTMGCKRILLSDDYLPALTKENVEVVTGSIAEIRPEGVVTRDGTLHEVDTIVFGTGFEVQKYPFASRVRGRGGRTLADTWKDGMSAHLGTTVAGYPSFFLLQGPNTALGHSSVITMLESQIEHIVKAVRYVTSNDLASIEPRASAQAAFVADVDRKMKGTVWTSGGCASWYLDAHGRNSAIWPGFTFTFKRRVERFDPADYVAMGKRTTSTSNEAGPRRGLADRLGAAALSAMCALPERVQIALSGGKPIVIDGHPLAPELQLLLAANEKRGQMALTTPAALRKQQSDSARLASGRPTRVGAVRDLEIDGAAGKLKARHYAPADPKGAPLLVFFHGGGFVFGDLDTHDAPCRVLCRHGEMHVLAVDYRLAPEHPFPAPVEDALAAFRWAQTHASELGADPARIGVGGDSAGANLSAVVAQLAVEAGGVGPACQMLIYPAVDRTRPYPSLDLFAEGFFLTRASIAWFTNHYSGPPGPHERDPRHGPLHAPSHAGLAPALVVTAGFDPLRDEGEAYAAALLAAGTITVPRRFHSLIHGFFNMVGVSPACRDAVIEIAGATRALFAMQGPEEKRAATTGAARGVSSGAHPS